MIAVRTKVVATQSKTRLVFFHGMFGSAFGVEGPTLYEKLTERMSKEHIATVGLYETSRRTRYDGSADFLTWANNAFAGKTFEQERKEVAQALKKIVKKPYKRLVFVGFSLGGTLSTYFLDQYKPDALLMFGSGCETRSVHMPLGKTYPPKKEILANMRKYQGIFKIYQGTDDTVVPKTGATQLLHAAKNAKRRDFIQLLGVDHRFMFRNGKPDASLFDLLLDEIKLVC